MPIAPRWFVFCLLSMIPLVGRAQQTLELPIRPKIALVLKLRRFFSLPDAHYLALLGNTMFQTEQLGAWNQVAL